mmetsp:Transcript_24099/g.52426  ORF Transcript_24099/g.52426 Transcript_24099/m.52426 type:complete len:313 (-) Transcript_24099:81-1019(-)
MNQTPDEAYRPFENTYPPFPPFHDATPCRCTYQLTVKDCLNGMYRAFQQRFFDFRSFDIDEYEYYERVECGDFNWIVKDKFLAFAGPHEHRMETSEGYDTLTPEDYIPYFKKNGIKLVIRLNRKNYDEQRFIRAGIKHVDLYYLDGSTPPDHILKKFIEICEAEPGAIAVHCKAGLGRTGTCIGCYMMKHYGFTAAETIGWTRVCRPGSIIGPQQHFMEEMEPILRHEGKLFRREQRANSLQKGHKKSMAASFGAYDHVDNYAMIQTGNSTQLEEKYSDRDLTQGDQLLSMKSHHKDQVRASYFSHSHHQGY